MAGCQDNFCGLFLEDLDDIAWPGLGELYSAFRKLKGRVDFKINGAYAPGPK